MIQVSAGQSQLSGWGHYAEPTTLFINKVPRPFMVGDTIDLSATRSAGGTQLHFTDGTVLRYLESGNLVPALTNVRVWSVPSEGSTVGATLDYVTIYASYTTKSGKVINAVPARVPVAVPSELRVIVSEEPLIDEGQYLNTLPTWEDTTQQGTPRRGIKNACHIKGVRFIVFWTAHGEVVRKTEAESINVYSSPFVQGTSTSGPYLIMGEKTGSATFTRYTSDTDEGEEITLDNAVSITFRTTIKNITLSAQTYFQMNPVVSWGLFGMPTDYTGTVNLTISVDDYSLVTYKNGKTIRGQFADNNMFWLGVWLRYLTVGGWYEYTKSQTITLGDGREGDLYQYCFHTYKDGNVTDKVAGRHWSCSGGVITWTNT